MIKKFVCEWTGRGYEKGEMQPFWLSLLREVFGISEPEKVIRFEEAIPGGYIDALIESTRVLIEQKSLSVKLDETVFQQAKKYNDALEYSRKARWIVTCNFQEFAIYDMDRRKPEKEPVRILLAELPEKIHLLDFLVDKTKLKLREDEDLSVKAGAVVDKLYETLKKNYLAPESEESLQSLNKLCVRIVFCLYAENSGVFGKNKIFTNYLETENDIRRGLIDLFRILNTPPAQRDPYDDRLNQFPYVNGGLFADNRVKIPKITPATRAILLNEVCPFKWQKINPTIFGAVFESTINAKLRRTGGMYYTSEKNIHKIIDPLFLDDLRDEFASLGDDKKALLKFQDKLASIKILDPACGSGNFLTESYISLRKLENEVLKKILGAQITLGTFDDPVKVSINQFYGIEIDNFAVAVAKTALWISELQMLAETAKIVHKPLEALPLKSYPNIHVENALTGVWGEICPVSELTYIISNPPFVGKNFQSPDQKSEVAKIFEGVKGAGNFDYVACWYKKASDFIQGTSLRAAFVSTNSIAQGEQVAPLWKNLNFHIDFAYRTFRWDSELKKTTAHVHVVIVGFSDAPNPKPKMIFDADGTVHVAQNINGYLLDAPNVYIENRRKPISNVPAMFFGSMPNDGGNLIIEAKDYATFIEAEPLAKKYIRQVLGSEEFINGKIRYCLWLVDCPPNELRQMKKVYERVKAVKEYRLNSSRAATRKLAEKSWLFGEIRQPDSNYILVPSVSGENRKYVPIGFLTPDIIVSNLAFVVPGATLYHFGVLTSSVHMAWLRLVCGRLESRYRYSATIVYNNFPWCEVTAEQERVIEATAQRILDVRAKYEGATLADLYDALAMPVELRRAHEENDAAVMSAYGFKASMSEPEIVAELMTLYQKFFSIESGK